MFLIVLAKKSIYIFVINFLNLTLCGQTFNKLLVESINLLTLLNKLYVSHVTKII